MIEVKLYIPSVLVHDFNKFWEIASEAQVKTYDLSHNYIRLFALVNGITFKWRGFIVERKKIKEGKSRTLRLKKVFYRYELPDGSPVATLGFYDESWKSIDDAAKQPQVQHIIEQMKAIIGDGWGNATYLERWISKRNKKIREREELLIEEAVKRFVKRLEYYGFIPGHIEELDVRDIYEQEV